MVYTDVRLLLVPRYEPTTTSDSYAQTKGTCIIALPCLCGKFLTPAICPIIVWAMLACLLRTSLHAQVVSPATCVMRFIKVVPLPTSFGWCVRPTPGAGGKMIYDGCGIPFHACRPQTCGVNQNISYVSLLLGVALLAYVHRQSCSDDDHQTIQGIFLMWNYTG